MIETLERIVHLFCAMGIKPSIQLKSEAYMEILRATSPVVMHTANNESIAFLSCEVKEYEKNKHKIEIIYSNPQGKEKKVAGDDLPSLYERLIVQLMVDLRSEQLLFVKELNRRLDK